MEGLITHSNSVSTISTEEKELLLQKQTAISNGNYILADQITKRIKALQSQMRSKTKMNVLKSKQETLQALDKVYKEELSSFNSEWELKENQLASSLEEKEKALNEKHKMEIDNLYKKFNDNDINNYKPSAKYLDLKKQEEELVKYDRFIEANNIKTQINALMQSEINKAKFILTEKINKTVERIIEKQNNEKNVFQKDAKFAFDSLAKAKERELERINVKYRAQRDEIEKTFNQCDIMKSKLKRNVTSSSSFGYKKNQICITEDPERKMKKLRKSKNSMSKSLNEKNGMSDDNNTQ